MNSENRRFGVGDLGMLEFDRFRLDVKDERLWRNDRAVELRPKTWQVLRELVERPGQLVTSSQLLDAVWSDVDVTLGTLTQSIAELRRILGDDASYPRFIQTVHRRGYRFVAEVSSSSSTGALPQPVATGLPQSPAIRTQVALNRGWLPGREAELERLELILREARAGNRRMVFVTGEAGIGKTTLIRTFLQELVDGKTEDPVWIAGGKCVEFVGRGETYLPVLEAFERLARIIGPELFRRTLRDRAPTWLAQIPWLLEADEDQQAASATDGPRPQRMLREFCAAVEALGAEETLVLWFEDLHWADAATVDLLSALASRIEPSRLCVLATYRPVEAAMNAHPIAPVKRNLVQQQTCVELPLGLLDKTAVQFYLSRQFSPGLESSLVDLIYEQTEGNPLFLASLTSHLLEENLVAQREAQSIWRLNAPLESLRSSAPDTLAALIELQLDHMDGETIQALEAGSVEGVTFGSRTVAAAIDKDVDSAEQILNVVAGRGRFLEALGAEAWPDGTAGERFTFLHAAYSHALYRRQAVSHRQRLHRRIATRLESGFKSQTDSVAAKLAVHFEKGGDADRAVHYLAAAAAGVRQRAGDREAVAYFTRALELLEQIPSSKKRARQELDLRMHLWKEINASGQFSTAEQDASLLRSLELCNQLEDAKCHAYVSSCHTRSLIIQCKLDAASAIDQQRAETAARVGDPILLAAAHSEAGDIAYWRGELDRSQSEQALCLRALDGVDPAATSKVLGHDPAVLALGFQGWASWLQGRPDEARRQTAASLKRAAGGGPLNLAFALALALQVEQFRRDADAASGLAARLMEMAEEYGFELPYPTIFAILGWTASCSDGPAPAIASLREGLAVCRRTSSLQGLSHLLATLAELELETGATRDSLATLDEAMAFVDQTGECFWKAEILRLEADLLLVEEDVRGAEASYREALELARSQGARSLELRAATSLSRLLSDESRQAEAQSLLAAIYDGFTEGCDAQDLRDAKLLLDSL